MSSQISLNRVSTRYYKPENTIDRSVLTRFEKIPTNIYETVDEGVKCIADEVIRKIQERQHDGKFCTLALGTGASLRPLYAELVRRHTVRFTPNWCAAIRKKASASVMR